jgi:hypothetical protein
MATTALVGLDAFPGASRRGDSTLDEGATSAKIAVVCSFAILERRHA